MAADARANAARTEKVLPGIWRLRLPLPWPGVPHGNAWAVESGDGIVLFDTGMGGKGRLRQLDLALAQAGFGVEDVGLLVCTHSHTDHYGLAASIVEATPGRTVTSTLRSSPGRAGTIASGSRTLCGRVWAAPATSSPSPRQSRVGPRGRRTCRLTRPHATRGAGIE